MDKDMFGKMLTAIVPFTVQIPRCNNLNQEYWYVPVSCSDSDFKKIMEWLRTSCTKK